MGGWMLTWPRFYCGCNMFLYVKGIIYNVKILKTECPNTASYIQTTKVKKKSTTTFNCLGPFPTIWENARKKC
jgi:hypothetical protein